jgi:anti-sigma regulatory factor (Ser/Thr protein kinase)
MSTPSEALRVQLAASDSAPFEARKFVKQAAGRLSEPLLADLLLVVTELVTNSVRHGPEGRITVELDIAHPGRVRGQVGDEGVATAKQRIADTEPETPGGFGLMLVDQLSRSWGVREGTTHVWFELAPAPASQ